MFEEWFKYNGENWKCSVDLCKKTSFISNLFFILPMLITNSFYKKSLYLFSYLFSSLFHNELCHKGKTNIILYFFDLLLCALIFFNNENLKYILKLDPYLNFLIMISIIFYYLGIKGWYDKKPEKYHIYHGLWHIFSGVSILYIELNLNNL